MSEKTVKYEYEYGLCKRMHYRGLWCVRYEGVPEDQLLETLREELMNWESGSHQE